jgi:hypothetical protein
MGENARKFVEQDCRIETMCARYADIYEDLLALPISGQQR